MITTLLLNVATWDLTLDSGNNIASVTGAYSTAQNVASSIRTFLGELWYDTEQGIPYFQEVLGFGVNQAQIQNAMDDAALAVPGVLKAKTVLQSLDRSTRTITGTIYVTDVAGQDLNITF
jgi:hypothetical protein